MFFNRAEIIKIDGKEYPISNSSNIDHFNCKSHLITFWILHWETSKIEELNPDNYVAWRKESVKLLKEWDKMYVKHEKTTNKELGAIQADAFLPLTDLLSVCPSIIKFKSGCAFNKLAILVSTGWDSLLRA